VPTAHTKGVLVAPTVFGNVCSARPPTTSTTASATGSTAAGLAGLLEKGRRILPSLLDEEVTAVYAGLRAATEHSDYQLSVHPDLRYVCLGGIRSTGLTASMALGRGAVELLGRVPGWRLTPRDAAEIQHVRRRRSARWTTGRTVAAARIVCHCELVTADEITAACREALPAVDVDGLRRRTRATRRRCQGFYCFAEVAALTGWDPATDEA
jgi:glycerol-3-phosphate dehydrogenase